MLSTWKDPFEAAVLFGLFCAWHTPVSVPTPLNHSCGSFRPAKSIDLGASMHHGWDYCRCRLVSSLVWQPDQHRLGACVGTELKCIQPSAFPKPIHSLMQTDTSVNARTGSARPPPWARRTYKSGTSNRIQSVDATPIWYVSLYVRIQVIISTWGCI